MPHRPSALTRTLDTVAVAIERIAGMFLAAITVLVFANALGRRYLAPIPDGFDMTRMLLMISILWGLAAVGYRDGHIKVDLLWMTLGRRGRAVLDTISWLCLLVFTLAFAWMLLSKVRSVAASNERSFDLGIDLWPMYGLAWLGVCASVVLILVRIWLLLRGEAPDPPTLTSQD